MGTFYLTESYSDLFCRLKKLPESQKCVTIFSYMILNFEACNLFNTNITEF